MLLHFCPICGNTETVFMYKPGENIIALNVVG